jgi:hypothetical protein
MPIRYERDDARRRVVVTVQGPFSVADFLAVMERQRDEGAWTYGMLSDLRGMTGEPAIDDLRQFLSEAARATEPRGPVALLATDPVIYRRACTYATLGSATLTVGVFRICLSGQPLLGLEQVANEGEWLGVMASKHPPS